MTTMIFIGSVLLVVTFSFAAWTTAAALISCSSYLQKRIEFALAISVGLGPIVLAGILYFYLWLLPERSNSLYLGLTLLSLLLASAIGFKHSRSMVETVGAVIRDIVDSMFRWSRVTPVIWLLCGTVLVLFLSALLTPVTANDSLEYLQAARSMYVAQDSSLYPPIDSARTGGMYGPWSHPPAYVTSLVWAFLLQGGAEEAGAAKLVAPYFSFASVVLLMYAAGGPKKLAGPLAALLLITTPFYYTSAMQGSIDSTRIFAFALSILCVAALSRGTWSSVVFASLAVAAAMFTHSIGVLVGPMMLAVGLLYFSGATLVRLKMIGVSVLIGAIITAPFYVSNFFLYGSIISDRPPLWALDSLHFDEYIRITRGLVSDYQRVMFGLFQGVSNYRIFGISYLVLIFCVSHWFVRFCRTSRNRGSVSWREMLNDANGLRYLSLVSLLVFYGGVVISMVLDQDTLIRNARYTLTMQPFVTLFSALYIASLFGEEQKND